VYRPQEVCQCCLYYVRTRLLKVIVPRLTPHTVHRTSHTAHRTSRHPRIPGLSSFICGNKMSTRCNRGFYCRSYCLLNMFRVPLCPSSGAQEYYTVVAACGISCCKNVKSNFVGFCGICVLSLKCRVLSRFVIRCVECRGGCVWVFLVGFL